MAHSIRFTYTNPQTANNILSQDEVKDLIEMFYRWDDAKFNIVFDKKHKRWRGTAQWLGIERTHEIVLYVENIKRDFKEQNIVGGSQKPVTEKMAMAMVLAHELQHCNQVPLHRQDNNTSFYSGHQYWNLASEREARGFVDEKLNEMCAYFGLPPQMRDQVSRIEEDSSPELDDVITLLAECDEVSPEDVNDELRASGILKPNNVAIVRRALAGLGIEVKKNKAVYFRT